MDKQKSSDLKILARLLKQAKPHWLKVIAIFFLDMLRAPVALLTPVPLMIAVDSAIGDKPLPSFIDWFIPGGIVESTGEILVLVSILVVVIAILTQLQSMGTWLLQTYTGEKLVLEMRSKLLRHAQRLSLAYHDKKGTADSIYRVQYDAMSIQMVIVYGITPFISSTFTLISMIIVTANIDSQLALVALTISPILIFLTQIFRRRLRSQWQDVKKLESSALSVVQEVLSVLRVVKIFGQENRENERFHNKSSEGVWARVKVVISESAFALLVGLTIAIGTAIVLFLGVNHVQAGLLTLGQLLLVMSYLTQLYQPLQTMGTQITKLQSGLTSAERAFNLLDKLPDVKEQHDVISLTKSKGLIQFKNVNFSYDNKIKVLKNISFEIPAGSRVGIVGKTGSGKSTLINLLMRLYDPSSGNIYLDSIDIRNYKLTDYRNQFAMVLQEPILLSTTIAENISYGNPNSSHHDIVAAAIAANADEFISRLPDGYDTQVGERGLSLSGGQRQRIAIARAFLKDAPILILDEPTSSVDTKTETLIIDAMDRLMQGRTTLMIAHRLTTLKSCDFIIRMDHGKILSIENDVSKVISLAS